VSSVRVTLDTPDHPPVGVLQLLDVAKAARAYRAAFQGFGDVVTAREALFVELEKLDERPST
jgi:hypothetical protein